jgi:hypothetical protein
MRTLQGLFPRLSKTLTVLPKPKELLPVKGSIPGTKVERIACCAVLREVLPVTGGALQQKEGMGLGSNGIERRVDAGIGSGARRGRCWEEPVEFIVVGNGV